MQSGRGYNVFLQPLETHKLLVDLKRIRIRRQMRGNDLPRNKDFVPHRNASFTGRFPEQFREAKSRGRSTCFYMDKPRPFGPYRRFAAHGVSLTIGDVLADLIGRQKVERRDRANERSQEQSLKVLRSFPYLNILRLV